MIWTEWWIELTGQLVVDPNLNPPAKYVWRSKIQWECWPQLPNSPNFKAHHDVEAWSEDSFKILLF